MRLSNSCLGCYLSMHESTLGILLPDFIIDSSKKPCIPLCRPTDSFTLPLLSLIFQIAMRVSFKQTLLAGSTTADRDVTCLQRWDK